MREYTCTKIAKLTLAILIRKMTPWVPPLQGEVLRVCYRDENQPNGWISPENGGITHYIVTKELKSQGISGKVVQFKNYPEDLRLYAIGSLFIDKGGKIFDFAGTKKSLWKESTEEAREQVFSSINQTQKRLIWYHALHTLEKIRR